MPKVTKHRKKPSKIKHFFDQHTLLLKITRIGTMCFIIIATIIYCLHVGSLTVDEIRVHKALQKDGLISPAQVTQNRLHINGGPYGTISYSFAVPSSDNDMSVVYNQNKLRVDTDTYYYLRDAKAQPKILSVTYLPSDPEVNRPSREVGHLNDWFFMLFNSVGFMVGVIMVVPIFLFPNVVSFSDSKQGRRRNIRIAIALLVGVAILVIFMIFSTRMINALVF